MLSVFEPPRVKPRHADAAGQHDLFPWLHTPRPFGDPPSVVDSLTSVEAARRARRSRLRNRDRLQELFRRLGNTGASDEEGAKLLGLDGNTYRPRRIELCRLGFVRDSGLRRATRAGGLAAVWCVLAEANP